MRARLWQREAVAPGQLWVRDRRVYRVDGICDDPTVVLTDVTTGQREQLVIGSQAFAEFRRLDPREPGE